MNFILKGTRPPVIVTLDYYYFLFFPHNFQSADKVNLNNVPVSEKQFMRLFEALSTNETLEDLSMANTTLGDFAAGNLAKSIESNKALEKINIESNNVSPQTLIKLFEVISKLA